MARDRSLIIVSLLLVLGIVLLGRLMGGWIPRVRPGAAPSNCDLGPFIDHLQILWERYLEMVQLLITLLTGVIAVSAGIVKLGPREAVADREDFALGIVSLLIGLFFAVMWRIDSQLLMEIEIFGNPEKVQALYVLHGVQDPFTSSFKYANHIQTLSFLARVFMVGTATGLIVGLGLVSRFAYHNLPEATRKRS